MQQIFVDEDISRFLTHRRTVLDHDQLNLYYRKDSLEWKESSSESESSKDTENTDYLSCILNHSNR
ncbi:hypothetical protein P5673_024216 [Acropora cervicornis]|uniref:Uncharacterized protein n=1 Tax=Acropora cervicornis TaxID=6130 RepID=A0AAD9Q3T6_ACRCE|nr:hypothetical protein P5673_024216 [Acropora cervicornis]